MIFSNNLQSYLSLRIIGDISISVICSLILIIVVIITSGSYHHRSTIVSSLFIFCGGVCVEFPAMFSYLNIVLTHGHTISGNVSSSSIFFLLCCNQCNNAMMIKRHMQVHTGEKPFRDKG